MVILLPILDWNKFQPYNLLRAYGSFWYLMFRSCMCVASPIPLQNHAQTLLRIYASPPPRIPALSDHYSRKSNELYRRACDDCGGRYFDALSR